MPLPVKPHSKQPAAAAAKPAGAPQAATGAKTAEPPKEKGTKEFVAELFANGNDCITAKNGSFPAKDDTQSLLALFSNGRF